MERLSDAESAQASAQREVCAEAKHPMRRAHLIFNPVAFGDTADGALTRILELLRAQGLDVEASSTTVDDPGDGVAAAALAQRPDVVIVAGGDGTIHAVARALLHTDTPLGIIPLGTVNNLADALHIPTDIEAACALIAMGQPHAMDAGLIDGRPFFEAVSLGVAAPFFPLAEETRHHGLAGLWRAIVKGVPLLLRAQRTRVLLEVDGKRRRVKAWEITITNIRATALHLAIAPDARLDDGQLDVVLNAESHWWQVTRDVVALLSGGDQPQPYVQRMRARRLRLRTPLRAPEAPITIDGEAMGMTPAIITVAPHALTVIVPPANPTASADDASDPAAQPARTPLAELLHSLTEPVRAPVKGAQRAASVARRYWPLGAALALLVAVGVGAWRWRRRRRRQEQ